MMQIAEIVVDPLVWKIPLMLLVVGIILVMVYYIYIGITLNMAKAGIVTHWGGYCCRCLFRHY